MKEGWEYKTLEEIAKDSADGPFGSNLKKEHYVSEKEVRIIQLSNIGEEGWREENKKYTSFEHLKAISRSEVCPGDIVIAKMMPAGRAILCPNNEKKYVLSSDAVKIRLKQGYNNKFVLYSINSSYFRSQVYSNVNGSGRVRTSLTKLRKCVLHIPDITTQESIVSYLDSSFKLIDEIKNKALKSLTEAKALFQSALAEAMEPKEGWEEKTLGEICFIARGGSPRPIKNFLTEDESGIPWIKIGDTEIGGKFINCTKEKIKKEGIKSSRFVRKGDFLLSNSMSFGRPYILKTDGCIHDGWLVLQNFKDTFIDDFLYYLLSCNYVQKQFDEYAYGSTVRNLKTDSVSRVSVNYPPLPTQKQIVSRLDKLSSKVRAIEEKYQKMVEECDALKQAMLRDVFE